MSRIGKKAIVIPNGVKYKIAKDKISVEGGKGSLELDLPSEIIKVEEDDGSLCVKPLSDRRKARAMHGTIRSLINNMVIGVTEGFVKELEIHGVGFRAAVKGDKLDLSVGKSHPILHPIPEGLKVSVNENTKIKVEGIDKRKVGQLAAEIRDYYPPEPYKGKGIRYVGEYVIRKEGKSIKK